MLGYLLLGGTVVGQVNAALDTISLAGYCHGGYEAQWARCPAKQLVWWRLSLRISKWRCGGRAS